MEWWSRVASQLQISRLVDCFSFFIGNKLISSLWPIRRVGFMHQMPYNSYTLPRPTGYGEGGWGSRAGWYWYCHQLSRCLGSEPSYCWSCRGVTMTKLPPPLLLAFQTLPTVVTTLSTDGRDDMRYDRQYNTTLFSHWPKITRLWCSYFGSY